MQSLMTLKILLPYKVFAVHENVSRISFETKLGSYGILPRRLDCIATLVPGILSYEIKKSNRSYLAVDEGILIKTKSEVIVTVRNAMAGRDLGTLQRSIASEFINLDKKESNIRQTLAKLESNLVRTLEKFRNK